MIKIIFYLYVYTIRSFTTWSCNNRFHKLILKSDSEKELIRNTYSSLANCKSKADLIEVYHKIYKEYIPDDSWPITDWSPSFHTMIYKEKDDCDGMAVIGKHILEEFCRIRNLNYKSIKVYSFVHLKSLRKSHAITILKTKLKGYYLFDYGKIYHVKNRNLLKRYFISHYLDKKFKSIKSKKIYMIHLPEPHGIKNNKLF